MRGTGESTQHLLIIEGHTQEAFFPVTRPSSLTSLLPEPIGRRSSWDAESTSVGDWLGRRSILLP